MASDQGVVTGNPVPPNISFQNATPDNSWVSRPIAENITEAMDNAPMGAMHDLVYSVLAKRMKLLLDPSSPLGQILPKSFVASAIEFRAFNPGAIEAPRPPLPTNPMGGSGNYQSRIFGPNHDDRLPHTAPMPVASVPPAMGQNPGAASNKGLMIAKLFADLESHIPAVLFNITSKSYVPISIGGASTGRRFWKDGNVVTELVYRTVLSVEALLIAGDDQAASDLQSIVEATFGTLRDHVGGGAVINGRSWQLTLPMRLSPSNITEVDAPWSGGDDKGAKLYTSTVGLEDMMFEAIMYVQKPVTVEFSDYKGTDDNLSISVPGETGSLTEPLKLRLGVPQKLIVSGSTMTCGVFVSQSKKVIELRQPTNGGTYEVVPRRTGEAVIRVFDTGTVVSSQSGDIPMGRLGAPLVERKVIVTAV